MKRITTLIIICITLFSIACSTSNDDKTETTEQPTSKSYNKLKAYDKIIAYYYYSPDLTRNANSRVYLDTISNIVTQYTSHRDTNQSDTSEDFGIKSSTIYLNYKNTNVDYIIYEVIGYEVNGSVADIKNAPAVLMISHLQNSDKYNFERFKTTPEIIFSNNFQNTEYYKKKYN